MSKHVHLEAIVLKRNNFGDADRFVTFFSQSQGKFSAIAKGSRRLTSTKRASLEPFCHLTLHLVKTGNYYLISETKLLDSFPSIRKDLTKTIKAYQILEIVDQLTVEDQAHPEIYLRLLKSLQLIGTLGKTNQVILNNIRFILEHLGFGLPEGDSDAHLKQHIESITDKQLVSKKFLFSH